VLKGKELSEGPRKVKGVGASCAKLIDEFIKTGKIEPK
jgi:DNA polymerase/3'-5' exonuclease PolX